MYGCESWTVKKAECRRIDAFELWCWRRLLRVPWIARRSTLSSQWKDWCWSRSSNTLACLEDLTHWKRPWCWERLKAGEGGDRGRNGWTASSSQPTWVWANSGRQRKAEETGGLQAMGPQRLSETRPTNSATTQQILKSVLDQTVFPPSITHSEMTKKMNSE